MFFEDDAEHVILQGFTEDGIQGEAWEGLDGHLKFSDVRRVVIVTTDQGPFLPDFFWVFETGDKRYYVAPPRETGRVRQRGRHQGLLFRSQRGVLGLGEPRGRVNDRWPSFWRE
ncbi:MAG: hypothetical protein ACTSU5_20250 [Promethearchaeota archaeon]